VSDSGSLRPVAVLLERALLKVFLAMLRYSFKVKNARACYVWILALKVKEFGGFFDPSGG
jgi:hypothetical protein